MPITSVIRTGAAAPRTTRDDVLVGQVFRYTQSKGKTEYASLGKNGVYYSFNLSKNRLDWSTKGDAPVEVVGTFEWKASISGGDADSSYMATREEVEVGQLFKAKENGRVYAHLGFDANDRAISAVMNASGNHAATENLDKEVEVVGTWAIEATVAG